MAMNDADRRKMRQQIESNDPALEMVLIKNYNDPWARVKELYYFPPDDDWKREGGNIGRNTHIKTLCLKNISLDASRFEEFCVGLAFNKSITRLEVENCALWGGDLFNYLGPFMEQNENLSSLTVEFPSSSVGLKSLTKTLSKFNTLQKFSCCRSLALHDGDLGGLIRTLEGQPKLADIKLSDVLLGGKGMTALAGLLENPQRSVRKLSLYSTCLDDEGAKEFANALGKSSTLHELSLAGCNLSITINGWRSIFTVLSQHSSLETLNLLGCPIDNVVAPFLGDALTGDSKLASLKMWSNRNILEGWRDVVNVLQSPHCLLRDLDMSHITLDDNLVAHLANSLMNKNCVLRRLTLEGIYGVSGSGWEPFSGVFRSNTALEKAELYCNSFADHVLDSFANSLIGNSELKELYGLDRREIDGEEVDVEESTWDAFAHSMCVQPSIMDTYGSNHTLQRLVEQSRDDEPESPLPPSLRSLLQINRENTRAEAARRKIIMVHFSGSDFSMQPFFRMKLKVLPQAIAWMARDELGHSLLYQYVRSSSVFVDVGSGSGAKQPEREPLPSKRQTVQ